MAAREGDGTGRRRVGAAVAARPFAVPWSWRVPDLSGLPRWFAGEVAAEIEHRRLFPWIAVAFGAGILLAFAADGPLQLWPPLLAAGLFGAGAVRSRHALGRTVVLVGAASVACGFAASVLRLRSVDAPVLQRMTIGRVAGFVESLDERGGGGGRLVIRVTSLDKVAEADRPARVRVTVRSLEGLAPGDYVTAQARLLPPPEAARPGGYDFARDAYFRGLGAVGSVSGRLARADPPPVPAGLGLRWAAGIDAARNALTARIAGAIGGQAGAVSAALVTGKRGLIDEATNDALRAAGIYHVVSISGLHMVLAAGVFFWTTRALLALSPAMALGWPLKKIAALVGMAAATGYCLFSGSEVATERSLLMILVMQGAVLVDRPALSMRNLALSALLVLAREPEALLGPSFQMSYAAVAGLIALAEGLRRWRRPDQPGDPVLRAARWLGAIALGTIATTLVATLATGPFSAFHFQNLQPYGLIGNAATLPLVSFAVMPAAVLGVLAYPFGLDRPVWIAMGWASEGVLRLSHWVAQLPTSTVVVPAFGTGALLLLALAILLATILRSRLRLLAAAPALLGLSASALPDRPALLVARDGSGAAFRTGEGRLVVLGRVPAFTVEQWLRADGDDRRADDPSLKASGRCDALGCTAMLPDGRAIAVLTDRRGFREDCRRATFLVSRLRAPPDCGASQLLDRRYLDAHGATSFAYEAGRLVATHVKRAGDTRPWFVGARGARPAGATPLPAPVTRATPPGPVPADDPPPAEDPLPPAEPPDLDP